MVGDVRVTTAVVKVLAAFPVAGGRLARRDYRLTSDGTLAARNELAALDQRPSKADGFGARKPCTT